MTSFSNFFFSKLLLNCQYASSELLIRHIALETPPPPCPIISVTLQNRRCDILTMIGQLCGGKKEVRVWTSFNLIVHSLHNCFCYFMRTTEWKTLIFFQERFLNDNACLPPLWNDYKHFLILMWSMPGLLILTNKNLIFPFAFSELLAAVAQPCSLGIMPDFIHFIEDWLTFLLFPCNTNSAVVHSTCLCC